MTVAVFARGLLAAVLAWMPLGAHAFHGNQCWTKPVPQISFRNLSSGSYYSAYEAAREQWDATPTPISFVGSNRIADIIALAGGYGDTGWLGIYIPIFYCAPFVGFTLLNDTYLRTYPQYAKLSVACHEMGHGLGLNHYDQFTNSCMSNPNFAPGPDQHDIDQLNLQY